MTLGVHFIGDEKGTELASMHGNAEVEEDIRQACVVKHYPKKHQFMDYLTCRAADYKSPLWETCTGKNGIDAAVIKKCYETEGKALLKDSFKLAGSGGVDAETIKNNFCNYNKGLGGCGKTLSSDSRVQGSCGQ
jgi:hypothetical protein